MFWRAAPKLMFPGVLRGKKGGITWRKEKSSLAVRMSISLVWSGSRSSVNVLKRKTSTAQARKPYGQRSTASCSRTSQRQALKKALGIFYIIGQLFYPFFTACHRTDGIHIHHTCDRTDFRYKNARQNFRKTIAGFLICSFFALLLMACVVGIMIYNAGVFNIQVEGLEGSADLPVPTR